MDLIRLVCSCALLIQAANASFMCSVVEVGENSVVVRFKTDARAHAFEVYIQEPFLADRPSAFRTTILKDDKVDKEFVYVTCPAGLQAGTEYEFVVMDSTWQQIGEIKFFTKCLPGRYPCLGRWGRMTCLEEHRLCDDRQDCLSNMDEMRKDDGTCISAEPETPTAE